ncbi:MAG: CAP domain-containing protein [Actinobacteria bacterium]|nr:CAP domain-containing protein [Actinomycetota bacterium]
MSARARARALSLLACLLMVLSINGVGAIESSGNALDGGSGGRWRFKPSEKCLMQKINRARARNGLRRLEWDKQVGVVARRHAKSMAANYSVFHDSNMQNEITRWKSLGQNSGAAGACRKLFKAFMSSSTHRSNILGRWRHMGVGVEKRNGKLFAQQIFEWRYNPGNIYRYP